MPRRNGETALDPQTCGPGGGSGRCRRRPSRNPSPSWTTNASVPSASTSPKRSSTTCADESPRRGGPRRRPSQTGRRACSWRRCRSSRATGAPSTTSGRFEARLNALPQFLTEIDGLDIHFIHVKSPHENALPLIITHGWPGSIIEMLNVDRPAQPTRRHTAATRTDAFDVVVPSMPGYGFSGKPTATGWDPVHIAERLDRADAAPGIHAVRRAGRRLGRADHRRDGCKGAAGAARHPLQHARHGPARRLEGADVERLRDRRSGADRSVTPTSNARTTG